MSLNDGIRPRLFKNCNYDRFFVTNKFMGLKQQLSGKIIEKLLNDVTKRRHMPVTVHGMTTFFKNDNFVVFTGLEIRAGHRSLTGQISLWTVTLIAHFFLTTQTIPAQTFNFDTSIDRSVHSQAAQISSLVPVVPPTHTLVTG